MGKLVSLIQALFLVFASPSWSGVFSKQATGNGGPASLTLGAGVRSAALGGAYVALADDPSGIYWNPAGLQEVPTRELQLMYARSYVDRTDSFLGYVHPFWGGGARRSIGASVSVSDLGAMDVVEDGQASGEAHPRDLTASMAYAQALGPLRAGVAFKTVRQDTGDDSAQAYAADAGVMAHLGDGRFSLGLGVANVGTQLEWGDRSTSLPVTVRGGAAWRILRPSSAKKSRELLWVAEGDFPPDHNVVSRTGVEFSIMPSQGIRVALRGGVASSSSMDGPRWSGGVGMDVGKIRFNAAFIPERTLGTETRVDLLFSFGRPLEKELQQGRLLRQANEQVSAGKLVKAQQTLRELEKVSPTLYEARKLSTDIRQRMAASLDPDLFIEQGQRYSEEGRWVEASALFRKAVILNPQSTEAQRRLKNAEKRLRADERERLDLKMVEIRREVTQQRAQGARRAAGSKKWGEAIVQWRQVLLLDPRWPKAGKELIACQEALYRQADRAQQAGNFQGALTLFQSLQGEGGYYRDAADRVTVLETEVRNRRRNDAKLIYDQGVTAYAAGRLEEALNLFRKASGLDPDNKFILRALERAEKETQPRRSSPSTY